MQLTFLEKPLEMAPKKMSEEVQLYKHVMQLFRKDFLVAMTIGPSCDRIPTRQ